MLPKLGVPYFILTNYVRPPSTYCCEIFVITSRNPESISRFRVTATPEELPDVEVTTIPDLVKEEALSWGRLQVEQLLDNSLPDDVRNYIYTVNLTFDQCVGRSAIYRLLSSGGLNHSGCDSLAKSECLELQQFANLLKKISIAPLKGEEF